jgi:predicted nuclease with TOPRIM domain
VGQPETLEEACERVKELEAENRRIDQERERYWVRNEFMKVRLKWAELETEELRHEVESVPETPSSTNSKNRQKHLKKKRRKKS